MTELQDIIMSSSHPLHHLFWMVELHSLSYKKCANWKKRKKRGRRRTSPEVALGVSFNAQSQAPDIPGASSRDPFLRHTVSLQTQYKTPDIYSLRAYREEFLVSLNAHAQAPDDPSQTVVSDFHFLGIPVVSQGVVCFHSVALGCSWTFTVIIINDPRGSNLFVSMNISFV